MITVTSLTLKLDIEAKITQTKEIGEACLVISICVTLVKLNFNISKEACWLINENGKSLNELWKSRLISSRVVLWEFLTGIVVSFASICAFLPLLWLFAFLTASGGFLQWESWSSCPDVCGTRFHQVRRRICANPTTKAGGADCQGSSETKKLACYDGCLGMLSLTGNSIDFTTMLTTATTAIITIIYLHQTIPIFQILLEFLWALSIV